MKFVRKYNKLAYGVFITYFLCTLSYANKLIYTVIATIIYRLEDVDSHAHERWRRANLDETLEFVLFKEQVLCFDPTHQGHKMVW